jgi:hypothetical protein
MYMYLKNTMLDGIIEHNKRQLHMTLEIQVLAWDRHKNVARVKLVNRIPTLLILIIGSPTATDIYK